MQTTAISAERLADELVRFFTTLVHGDQGGLFAVVAEFELTLPQMRGLFVIDAAEQGIPLTELAPQIGLSVAAAGRAVDGLVRKGLVSRSEDTSDRRVKRLALTDDGRAAIARMTGARREGFRQFAETLDARQRELLVEACTAVLGESEDVS